MPSAVYLTGSPLQSAPAAGTLTTIFTVPTGYQVNIPSAQVCNLRAAAGSFRISVAPHGAADDLSQYLYYDVPMIANDSFKFDVGCALAPGDQIRVFTSSGGVSFTFYNEIASRLGVV
jgi:hypothetical protein